MAENEIARLHFYQGQFLRAQDFSDEQTYQRDMRRRHNLGQHIWGIVSGLELLEQDQELGGGKDIYVQPGLAVDGYGREIVVMGPYKLNNSDFIRFTTDNHYAVWIAYAEEEVDHIPPGYGGCDPQHNRIRETFQIFVQPVVPQPDRVIVDGKERKPPVDAEDTSNIPPDLSVPYQELPDDDRQRWMIPLGSVRWDGGKFIAAAPGKLVEGRQYAGAVGAVVFAPAGQLRLADRLTQPFDAADAGVAVTVQGSLLIERETTAHGNVHLDGVHLDFRLADGAEGDLFLLERVETGLGDDLRIRIGKDTDGNNRLVVGAQTGDTSDTFVETLSVLDSNTVGVRAPRAEHPLQVGDGSAPVIAALRGPDHNVAAASLAFEDTAGTASRWLRLVYDSEANLLKVQSAEIDPIITFGRTSGQVGIGTNTPNRLLTVYSEENAYLNVRANGGAQEVLLGADTSGGIISTMTNHDLQLRAGANSTKMVIKADGDIGVGLTNPRGRLHVVGGNDITLANDTGFLVMGEVNSENMALDNNEIQARNNGSASTLYLQAEGGALDLHFYQDASRRVLIDEAGRLGLGTATPASRLHVMGSVRLGAAGNLFAIGSQVEMRLVSGSHNGDDASSSGSGYSVNRNSTGVYTVTFTTPFSGTPTIVASSSNSDEDHIVTLRSIGQATFQVTGHDVGNFEGDLQNTSFQFIAVGPV